MAVHSQDRRHLLLLAGSGEARAIATALAGSSDLRVTASLLCAPRSDVPLAVPTRLGRFAGAEGFLTFLGDAGIDALLDATHPFAVRISAQAAGLASQLGLPHAQVLRPPWSAGPGDRWRDVADERAAAALIRPGQRVFTNIGRARLPGLVRDVSAQFVSRRLGPGSDDTPANVTLLSDMPPFSVAHETETLRALGIDLLVVHNSGGEPSRTKLDAARALGLPVILIDRPVSAASGAPLLDGVDSALAWVAAL